MGKNSEHLRIKSKRLSTRKSHVSTKSVSIKKKKKKKKNTFLQKSVSIIKKDIWKVIHRILSHNPKTLKVDPEKLKEFFNKTAEQLVGKKKDIMLVYDHTLVH